MKALLAACYLSVIGALVYGWILNIIAIFHSTLNFSDISGTIILRIVGIFVAPLGSLMGYL